MRAPLVLVCFLSYVSCRQISSESGGYMVEKDPDLQSMTDIQINFITQLINDLKMTCNSGLGGLGGKSGVDGRLLCSNSVRVKYAQCLVICAGMDYFQRMTCNAVMYGTYLTGCFGTDIPCYGSQPTTAPPMTTASVTTSKPVTSSSQTGVCGISPVARIAGGSAVSENNKYPWQVGLSKVGLAAVDFTCTGTVITKRHILTAASCVNNKEVYDIWFGTTDEAKTANPNAKVYKKSMVRAHIHKNFNSLRFDNDIAIIEFNDPIDFDDDDLSPICLPTEASDNLRFTATISGWGQIGTGSGTPVVATPVTQLQEGQIQIDECPEDFRYTENMLCTEVDSVDACLGDGGGPVIVDFNGQFQQIGIATNSDTCKPLTTGVGVDKGSDAIFTNVGRYIDWIKEKVAPEIIYIRS